MVVKHNASRIKVGELPLVIAGMLLAVVGAFMPWLSARSCGHRSFSLIGLPISRWIVAGLLLLIAGATVARVLGAGAPARAVAVVAASLLLIGPILGIVIIELLALWAYPEFLPATWRRFLPGAVPLAGIWLFVLGAGLVLIGSSGGGGALLSRIRLLTQGGALGRLRTAGLIVAASSVPLLMVGRTSTWLSASSPAGSWSVAGYAIPWLGLVSLILLLLTLALVLATFWLRALPVAAALVTCGWMLTLGSTLVLILFAALPSYTIPDWLHRDLVSWTTRTRRYIGDSCQLSLFSSQASISIRGSSGPWLVFAGGIAAAIGGLLTLASMRKEEG